MVDHFRSAILTQGGLRVNQLTHVFRKDTMCHTRRPRVTMRSAPMKAFLLFVATFVIAVQAVDASEVLPARPVRYICPLPAGGDVDIVTRIVGIKLSEIWGQ